MSRKQFTIEQHLAAGRRLKELRLWGNNLCVELANTYGKSSTVARRANKLFGHFGNLEMLLAALDSCVCAETPRSFPAMTVYYGPVDAHAEQPSQ